MSSWSFNDVFMLKDKQILMDNIGTLLLNERRLIRQVSSEMNVQIGNYIRKGD